MDAVALIPTGSIGGIQKPCSVRSQIYHLLLFPPSSLSKVRMEISIEEGFSKSKDRKPISWPWHRAIEDDRHVSAHSRRPTRRFDKARAIHKLILDLFPLHGRPLRGFHLLGYFERPEFEVRSTARALISVRLASSMPFMKYTSKPEIMCVLL